VALGATDMRKGFDGLYGIVRDKLGLEVRSGHLFLFANARRSRLKVPIMGWERPVVLRKKVRTWKVQLATGRRWIGSSDAQS